MDEDELGKQLLLNRPTPDQNFRSELRTRLVEEARSGRRAGFRTRRSQSSRSGFLAALYPQATIAAYGLSGFLLLGFAAIGVAGAGPLSA